MSLTGNKTTLCESKKLCAERHGVLFDGGLLNVTSGAAAKYLKSQNKTIQDWFWVNATYINATMIKAFYGKLTFPHKTMHNCYVIQCQMYQGGRGEALQHIFRNILFNGLCFPSKIIPLLLKSLFFVEQCLQMMTFGEQLIAH